MQWPHHVARGVWHHQAHEADGPHHADDGGRHQCSEREQHQPCSGDIDAQCRCRFITEGKGIQHTRIHQAPHQAHRNDQRQQGELGPAYAAEASQQPEHHVTCLLGVGSRGNNVGSHGVEKLRGGHTGQDGSIRTAAHGVGQERHKEERCKCTGEGAHRQANDTHPHTQDDNEHRAGGCACRYAQHVGFCKRVAQQRLHHRPGKRQPGTTEGGRQRAGKSIVPDHRLMDATDVDLRPAQPVGDGMSGRRQWNGQITDADAHTDSQGDDEQRRNQQRAPEGQRAHQRTSDLPEEVPDFFWPGTFDGAPLACDSTCSCRALATCSAP